jgi:hypothetical protein
LSQTSKALTTGAVGWFVCGEVIVRVHSQHLGTLLQDVNNKAEDSIMIMCFISQKYTKFAICQVMQL